MHLKSLSLAIGLLISQTAFATQAQGAPQTMQALFTALKSQPQTQLDQLAKTQANTTYQTQTDALYPKISIFGDASHSNQLRNFKPVAPSELGQGKDFPFAHNLISFGIQAGMPIYAASLYALNAKAQKLIHIADIQAQLNLLQNEALLVGYNADLKHSLALTKALKAQKDSLSESRQTIEIKVQSGRSPRTQLTNINEHINTLDQKLLALKIQRATLQAKIFGLTHIQLTQAVPMVASGQPISEKTFIALHIVDQKKQAAEAGLKAAQGAYYPKVSAYAKWSNTYGEAYNTHKNISRDFGVIGININIPLFDPSLNTHKQAAQEAIQKANLTHQKLKQELSAKATSLKTTLMQLKAQKALAIQSIENQKALLKTAKVAFQTGQMTQEEYLRYEDKLSIAKAKLYATEANWWHAQATLAFLYGNNIEALIK